MSLKSKMYKILNILTARVSFAEKILILLRAVERFISSRLTSEVNVQSSETERFLSQLSDLRYLCEYKVEFKYVEGEKKIWFFFNQIDSRYIFGGWIAVLNFIIQLRNSSFSVGVVSRKTPYRISDNELLNKALMDVEINIADSGSGIECTKDDIFIAYDWVTSYLLLTMKRRKSLDCPLYYFCQEDESIFYSNGSVKAFVREVHSAIASGEIEPIFNSAQLKRYFSDFLKDKGLLNKLYFEQAISSEMFVPVDTENTKKYVLVYGRPESHAERNMFEMVVLLLSEALRKKPLLFNDVEFLSIGSCMFESIPLSLGKKLKMIDRLPYDQYMEVVTRSVAVVALMYAPHPSVPPFESIRNGVRTIVNCNLYGRDEAYYRQLSSLFYPASSNPDSLSDALIDAVEDYQECAGAETQIVTGIDRLPHPQSWSESFVDVVDSIGMRGKK